MTVNVEGAAGVARTCGRGAEIRGLRITTPTMASLPAVGVASHHEATVEAVVAYEQLVLVAGRSQTFGFPQTVRVRLGIVAG